MSYLRIHDIGNIKISFHMDTEEGLKKHEQHREAMDLVAKVVQQGPFVFTVPSSLQMDKQYIVQKGSECLEKKCPTRCLLCQACMHSLTCECETSESVTCKHVHAVNMWCKFQRQHRTFYEHEQEVTEISTSYNVETKISRNDKHISNTDTSINIRTEDKSIESQLYIDKTNELEALQEDAKILLVELIAMIEECKDIEAIAKFIDLLSKTKTALKSKLKISGKCNEHKVRLANTNSKFSRYSENMIHNSLLNKVNNTKRLTDRNCQPIKIIANQKATSLNNTQNIQLNNISIVSSISQKSNEIHRKFKDKSQSQQDQGESVRESKQKSKRVMVMLDSTDNKILLQDINCVKEGAIKPITNLSSEDHKIHLISDCMTRTDTIAQTNNKTEPQQLVPSSSHFIEENNQLLSSYINDEHILSNIDSENIKLSMKVDQNSIELHGTIEENVRNVNMNKFYNNENIQSFYDNSCVQEDLGETVRKIRTFVRDKDGQLKEFFFKIKD
ncbi:unnamed protein product [Meganyctiphanes norvegica]|uniref:SWIM-type domain-containing protein n=1 Tax=Meganyctiphanes norvegica TaxID=48144 RepID=A0AAV2PX48_MEGNR